MDENLLFRYLNSQKAKENRCRFVFLKMDCHCHNSFLLFCRLLVLSERTVDSFRGHVAYPFYPSEDLNIATCYHANNFQRDKTVEINRSGEEGKGRYAPSSVPSLAFWLC